MSARAAWAKAPWNGRNGLCDGAARTVQREIG